MDGVGEAGEHGLWMGGWAGCPDPALFLSGPVALYQGVCGAAGSAQLGLSLSRAEPQLGRRVPQKSGCQRRAAVQQALR